MTTTVNARIDRTFLGVEDHGMLTFFLTLRGDSWSQGFGGFVLDSPTPFCGKAIRGVLETLKVESWEKLPGTIVRVEWEGAGRTIRRLGHAVEDRWFDLGALATSEQCQASAVRP